MLVLCGFPISNYYNKVKLALLEKGVAVRARSDVHRPARHGRRPCSRASPLGKIPFIRTDAGTLCESQAILEYIESALSRAAAAAGRPVRRRQGARARHLHRPAPRAGRARALPEGVLRRHAQRRQRRARPQAARRATSPRLPAPGALRAVRRRPDVHPGRLRRLGERCRVVAMATQAVYGEDLLAAGGIDWKPYSKLRRRAAERAAGHRRSQGLRRTVPRPPG